MDLIDKAAFVAKTEERYCVLCRKAEEDWGGVACSCCWVHDMVLNVDQFETVEAEPVRHGRWIRNNPYIQDQDFFAQRLECSECGYEKLGTVTNYCSNCGSKMDVKEV